MWISGNEIEIQKIKNHIIATSPVTIDDFVNHFFELLSKYFISLDNYITAVTEMELIVIINDAEYELFSIIEKKVTETIILDHFDFLTSEDYFCISSFANKFEYEATSEDYSQLQILLKNRGWDIPLKYLIVLAYKERKKEINKKKIEFARDFEEAKIRYPTFPSSEQHHFVKQFAKKYSPEADSEKYSKLQALLKNRGWDFSHGELLFFVSEENEIQQKEDTKAKILMYNPQGQKEILKSYLNFFRSNDTEMLQVLAEIFREKGLSCNDIDYLKILLENIEKEIEIENFEKLLAEGNERIGIKDVDKLSGYKFEGFLKNLYSKMGYQVEQTRLSGDQGADLVVIKFGEKTVIQAKRFGGKVGNKAVQEIMAAISLYKAQKGMVVTNNYFTPAAVELANANNIELIDRNALEELINKHW